MNVGHVGSALYNTVFCNILHRKQKEFIKHMIVIVLMQMIPSRSCSKLTIHVRS